MAILLEKSWVSNLILNTARYATGLKSAIRKKTFACMARFREINHDQVRSELRRSIKEIPEVRAMLWRTAQEQAIKVPGGGAVIVDTTVVVKRHAQAIEGLARHRVEQHSAKGIKLANFSWTDMQGNYLPVDLVIPKTSKSHELLPQAISLAQRLGASTVLADAFFSTINAWQLLSTSGIYATMRFSRNRVVTIAGFGRHQLQHHPGLKFSRNQHIIIREVYWRDGISLCIIALKIRHRRKKWRTLYLATNAPLSKALQYAQHYRHRWGIESMFRSLKQDHGLQDCQARSLEMQRAHFFATLLASHNKSTEKPDPAPKKRILKKKVPIQRKISKITTRRARTQHMSYAAA
jgi:hypothetical protein